MPAPVPVNLVTGMLGAGKTSTILHLLSQRPPGERWAVLVNDFGAVGLDGALLESAAEGALSVREVSGGCICCTAALHLRQGLVALLRAARPDRLLIEPSGLGHPAAILDLLAEPGLAAHLRLRAVVGVFDADGFSAERLQRSDLYREQLELADVALLNRSDLAGAERMAALAQWFAQRYPPPLAVLPTTHGAMDPALLDGGHEAVAGPGRRHLDRACLQEEVVADGTRFRRLESAEGVTLGWIWPREWRWHGGRLRPWLEELAAAPGLLRLKGVLRTGRNWQRLDIAGGRANLQPVAWRRDSRLELVAADEARATELRGRVETGLLALRV